MDPSGDDLAGIVDLFDALTREELQRALAELAFKRGRDIEPSAFGADIDRAVENYQLVRLDAERISFEDDGPDIGSGDSMLVAGPSAFPTPPDGARDLRHILDIGERNIERDEAGEAAARRLREDAKRTIEAGDTDAADVLIDVSYEIEAWAPVDLTETRGRLDGL